ncbi:hypothetical protein AB0K51_04270 [Kitasatospora sp. NPDC049285]|uniref:hypothetical protein n=1 Tax=Kitasatospora sp. NPDC049285 TaxID=3157096 RepID=UPI003442C728
MLPEALAALAAAGGTAVVQAAGTDAWTGLRSRIGGWFGGDDAERRRTTLARLDDTARVLTAPGAADDERLIADQRARWQVRFEDELESLAAERIEQAAAQLRHLLKDFTAAPTTTTVTVRDNEVGGSLTVVTGNHNRIGPGDSR